MSEIAIHQANGAAPVVSARGAKVNLAAPLARFSFRGPEAACVKAGPAFRTGLPTTPLSSSHTQTRAALWLGPDEWLLLAADGSAGQIFGVIEAALGDTPHALVDVSERNTALIVSGPRAAWLLNSQLFLDLDDTVFHVGMATRTLFAKAEIVLWRTGKDQFVIECWRSFLPYVAGLLAEVARELEVA
ncbi:sarcosine oxidase subunit gamma [Stappia sp. F7233]|uniref:Sarcosine oxidase subunit gamma n=1 Tax=Stappia albiluteola TaxID=2758565 RepID=A0A839ACY6_9HYPH|nr:sarcosine oxidase subunit gamma family protein [Stappia albiluteola]MBA5776878.1 sarcosine oxidase subunit gamma [Stappia albiluteola]